MSTKNVVSFSEFVKMGTHELVKAHYSGEEKGAAGYETLEDQDVKHPGEETKSPVDHTEELKAKDLADPKVATPNGKDA